MTKSKTKTKTKSRLNMEKNNGRHGDKYYLNLRAGERC